MEPKFDSLVCDRLIPGLCGVAARAATRCACPRSRPRRPACAPRRMEAIRHGQGWLATGGGTGTSHSHAGCCLEVPSSTGTGRADSGYRRETTNDRRVMTPQSCTIKQPTKIHAPRTQPPGRFIRFLTCSNVHQLTPVPATIVSVRAPIPLQNAPSVLHSCRTISNADCRSPWQANTRECRGALADVGRVQCPPSTTPPPACSFSQRQWDAWPRQRSPRRRSSIADSTTPAAPRRAPAARPRTPRRLARRPPRGCSVATSPPCPLAADTDKISSCQPRRLTSVAPVRESSGLRARVSRVQCLRVR